MLTPIPRYQPYQLRWCVRERERDKGGGRAPRLTEQVASRTKADQARSAHVPLPAFHGAGKFRLAAMETAFVVPRSLRSETFFCRILARSLAFMAPLFYVRAPTFNSTDLRLEGTPPPLQYPSTACG